jgi:hypothetical protein
MTRHEPSRAAMAGMLAACVSMAGGCSLWQAVYVPAGWEPGPDGMYRLHQGDIVASMPIMVVAKSDRSLHPAISMTSTDHELRFKDASWILAGHPLAPYSHLARDTLIDGHAPLNLHWSTEGMGKMMKVLGNGSTLHIDVTTDGKPAVIKIEMIRRDHL